MRMPFTGRNYIEDSDPASLKEAETASNVDLSHGSIRKIAGWSLVGTVMSKACLGLFHWDRLDGTTLRLARFGDDLYKIDGDASITLIQAGVFATTLIPSTFAVYGDRCYISHGAAPLKVTDGTTVNDAEITRPPVASTYAPSASNVTTLPPGEYDFKFTYYSSTWFQESHASDASTKVKVASTRSGDGTFVGTEVEISIPADAGLDSRVDKVRIYRRQVDTGEVDWTFVAEQNYTGALITYVDETNVPDSFTAAPLSVDIATKDFHFVKEYQGVLFAGGVPAEPARLYYSNFERPWSLSRFTRVGTDGDGDPIRGMSVAGGQARVYKRRSIWNFTGNSISTFFAIEQVKNSGAVSHLSIVEKDSIDYFLSNGKVLAYDGSETQEISQPVNDLISSRKISSDARVAGFHDEESQSISWFLASDPDGDDEPDTQLTWFYENSRRSGKPSWQQATSVGAEIMLRSTLPGNGGAVTYVAHSTYGGSIPGMGYVSRLGGGQRNGSDFTMDWVTNRIDGGRPMDIKSWQEVEIEVTKQTSSSPLQLGYRLNGGGTTTWLKTFSQTESILRGFIGRSSRDLQLVLQHSGSGACEIRGVKIEAQITELTSI
jgi:hypothetical protein